MFSVTLEELEFYSFLKSQSIQIDIKEPSVNGY